MNSTIKLLEGLKVANPHGYGFDSGYNAGLDQAIERLRTVDASRDTAEHKDLERQIYEQFRNGLTLCDAALLQDAIGAMIQVAISEALEHLSDKLEESKP